MSDYRPSQRFSLRRKARSGDDKEEGVKGTAGAGGCWTGGKRRQVAPICSALEDVCLYIRIFIGVMFYTVIQVTRRQGL